jgi:shikimate kinase
MIVRPEEMSFENKKFVVILYGSPGIGKTTLAFSAPKPILVDFDKGVSRVKVYHRKDTIMCSNYKEVLSDIASPAIKDYETIVIDTGGGLVTYLQDWAMKENPAVNTQKNGAISLKGFGAVKAEFIRFSNYVRDILNKNLIYIFHSVEEKDKEGNPTQRLLCEGSARNLVWQPADLGGYIQMIGNKRTISFTPEQEFFAKGCYGIEGRKEIPTLSPADKNDFLTRLFEEAKENLKKESEVFLPVKQKYEEVMEQTKDIVEAAQTADDVNKAVEELQKLDHALTSKKESALLLHEKATSLGLTYDKTSKTYRG